MKNKIKQIIEKLKNENKKIAFAESVTGGLLASTLVTFPGASKVLSESYITYSEDAKKKILGVKQLTIEENTIVSEAVSSEMCEGLKRISNADICVAITGNAGPSYEKNTNTLESYLTIIIGEYMETIHLTYNENKRVKILENIKNTIFDCLYNLI